MRHAELALRGCRRDPRLEKDLVKMRSLRAYGTESVITTCISQFNLRGGTKDYRGLLLNPLAFLSMA